MRKVHNVCFGATTSKRYGSTLNKEFTILKMLEKKLKETNRTDMTSDIEDAEFLIEDYKNKFGF